MRCLFGMLAFFTFCVPAFAQSEQNIVGAWSYTAVETVRPDGSRSSMYGPDPKGVVIFDANGHYALIVMRTGLPKFASKNRMTGTPDEYKAVVQGAISHFGRYKVNELEHTITFQIDYSTFPNWDSAVQTRPFTLTGDVLKWTTPGASGGGTGEIVLKRVK